jgi:hypothetical protein
MAEKPAVANGAGEHLEMKEFSNRSVVENGPRNELEQARSNSKTSRPPPSSSVVMGTVSVKESDYDDESSSTFPALPMDSWKERVQASKFGTSALWFCRIAIVCCILAYTVTVCIRTAESYANPNTEITSILTNRTFPSVLICPSAAVFSPIYAIERYVYYPGYSQMTYPTRLSAFDDSGNRCGAKMFFNGRKLYYTMVEVSQFIFVTTFRQ